VFPFRDRTVSAVSGLKNTVANKPETVDFQAREQDFTLLY
jgi:hypothetical protein